MKSNASRRVAGSIGEKSPEKPLCHSQAPGREGLAPDLFVG